MTESQKLALDISEKRQALVELTEAVNAAADGPTDEPTNKRIHGAN